MGWVRLDDNFSDHPKIIAVGPIAGWLFVCGLAYCGKHLTNGHIPLGQVRRLADIDNAMEAAEKLVSERLWERTETGFLVHDYLVYQPSREYVEGERLKVAERQKKFRERQANAVTSPVTNATTNASQNPLVTPSPSHPIPSHSSTKVEESSACSKEEEVRAGSVAVRLVQEYVQKYTERFGKRPTMYPNSPQKMELLMQDYSESDIEQGIDGYLKCKDEFVVERSHPFALMCKQFSAYIPAKRTPTPSRYREFKELK